MVNKFTKVGDKVAIDLPCGRKAVVDEEDFETVSSYKWLSSTTSNGVSYAFRYETSLGKKHKVYMHRQLLNFPEGHQVDHKDGDGLNNTRDNLRLATKSENQCNRGKSITNTSGFKGVYWKKDKKKWYAQICKNYDRKFLGYFDTKEDAFEAYCVASKELHGEFGRTE